jgi:uncharacterized protein (TIGR03435 family)
MRMRPGTASFALAVLLGGSLLAQTPQPSPADQKLSFEVASIKPNKTGPGNWSTGAGGRETIIGRPVRALISQAFGLQDYELIGGPSWMDTDLFDVIAQGSNAAKPDDFLLMMRALLEERFALKSHREVRQGPIYRLVLARSDGKLGPQLRKSPISCAEFMRSGGKPVPSRDPRVMTPCSGFGGNGQEFERARGFSTFVVFLQNQLSQPIEDVTGLTGEFDIDLEWSVSPADTSKPSIFTALQDQLGLKLEAARGPINVVVIDSIQHPTPD